MIRTPKHLAYVLRFDLKEIYGIIGDIDSFYTEHIIPKKNGVRIINPSHRRLKVLQKRIQKKILIKVKLPDYAYGSVKGRDNVDNANRHKGKKYKFTTDLRNFFPSVDHHRVNQMFLSYNFSPTVSRLLTQLTTYKGRLPQGAPTSSSIANHVFVKTGLNLESFAKEHQITFTSFVDDLAFSSPFDFKGRVGEIVEMITQDGFKISHDKTFYARNPIITGLHPMNNHLHLSAEFLSKLANSEEISPDTRRGQELYKQKVQRMNSNTNKK